MGDSDSHNANAAWQKAEVDPKSTSTSATELASNDTPRAAILAQARSFLEQDEVRDAHADKKIRFLEEKGLTGDEIKKLLQVTKNTTVSSAESQSSFPVSRSIQLTSKPRSQSASPPIVTYPEYLVSPRHPSSTPLVTQSRLLTTLYAFSLLSAAFYGTHNYLITPMLTRLTASRLSLALTAQQNLSRLIARLERLVSVLPVGDTSNGVYKRGELGEQDEEDEDPTELFHRDIGVQTLPSDNSISTSSSFVAENKSSLTSQTMRLTTLTTSLNSVLQANSNEGHTSAELEGTIALLREYLDSMAYVPPTNYSSNVYSGAIYSTGGGVFGGYNSTGDGKEDDEIAKLRKSIKTMKGTLLSARSFPGVRIGGAVAVVAGMAGSGR